MAVNIQIKRSTGTTAPSSLANGELAYTHGAGTQANNGDRLFIGDGSNVNVIGGEYFISKLDHVDGTLTASSALTSDSSSRIDTIVVGNASSAGGIVELREGTSNGNNYVRLAAPNALGSNVTFTLPNADGSSGQFLKTNGSGTLSFDSLSTSFTLAADSGTNDTFSTGGTLTFTGGEGIDTTVSNDAITIAAEDATTSNKGVASFASADFSVSSGAVSIKSGGVTNTQLAGSIANAKLANDGITIGSDDTSLGDTITDLNGLTSIDVDDITIDGAVISTTTTDASLELTPNGTGVVSVPSGYESRSQFGSSSLVNKAYVDSVASGIDVRGSVKGATTANLAATYNNGTNGVGATLTASANGALSIDGLSFSTNDRILVKNQTTATQNGVYSVTTVGDGSTAFVLTRATDADTGAELTGGIFLFVEQGTANADNGYVGTHNGTPTVGSDNITFEQFSGAGQISAGNGLTKTGNTINAVGTANKISVSADAITIASTYVGQTSITTLGTISTGTWSGTEIGVASGGTGLTAAAKGSVLVANAANTISALDGGGSNDGVLLYTSSSDTISWTTSIDGGTF